MNRSTLAALVVALMLGSGIAGYLIGKPGDSVDQIRRTATASQHRQPPHRRTRRARSAQRPPRPDAGTLDGAHAAAQPAAAPDEAFAYRRVAIDSSRPEAEACLCLQQAAGDRRRQIRRLCAHHARGEVGAARGRRPPLRRRPDLRPGLHGRACCAGFPGSDGAKLDDEKKVDVALGARPAVVTLPGKGFILPRGTRGRPADHHHQRLQGRHRGLSRQRARPSTVSPATATTRRFPGSEPVTESWSLRGWLNGTNGVRQWRGTMDVRNVAQPAGDHRLPDPRDDQGLEARRLFRRGVERRQAAVAQLRRRR